MDDAHFHTQKRAIAAAEAAKTGKAREIAPVRRMVTK